MSYNFIFYELECLENNIIEYIKENDFQDTYSRFQAQAQLSNGFNHFIHKSRLESIRHISNKAQACCDEHQCDQDICFGFQIRAKTNGPLNKVIAKQRQTQCDSDKRF
jgi:hypothetical protein